MIFVSEDTRQGSINIFAVINIIILLLLLLLLHYYNVITTTTIIYNIITITICPHYFSLYIGCPTHFNAKLIK